MKNIQEVLIKSALGQQLPSTTRFPQFTGTLVCTGELINSGADNTHEEHLYPPPAVEYKYAPWPLFGTFHPGTVHQSASPKMMKYVVLAAALVACVAATPIDVKQCSDDRPLPVSFDVPQCPAVPCDVYIGQEVTLNIGIRVDGAVDALPVTAHYIVGGVEFPVKLPSGDACNAIATGCPRVAGTYMITFPVTLEGPPADVDVTVRVEIKDHKENTVACGLVTTMFS